MTQQIGATLDAILESRLQFKKPKESKDKHKASQSDCTGVSNSVAASSADGEQTEHTEQDPKYISHGFGIRLFKRTKAGQPVLERTGR